MRRQLRVELERIREVLVDEFGVDLPLRVENVCNPRERMEVDRDAKDLLGMTTSPISVAKPANRQYLELTIYTPIAYPHSVEAYQQPNLAVQPNRPTRYRLSHHSIVVMLPNHWCATSWHWNATTDFFVSMSARSGSRQYALVRPVIKP
jgi:hypothetical protein